MKEFVQHYAAHFKDALKFLCVSNFMVVQSREVREKNGKQKRGDFDMLAIYFVQCKWSGKRMISSL